MDRRPVIATALAAASAACGGAHEVRGSAGLEVAAASRGALAYAVALGGAADRTVVSVELGEAFELVERAIVPDPRGGVRLREDLRVRLGPPEWDVDGLALEPGAGAAWVASADGEIRRVPLARARTAGGARGAATTWRLGDAATALAVSPDGRYLVAGGASGLVCLRRLSDGALLQCMLAHGARVAALAFSPDGGRVASAGWDGRVTVWSVPALARLASLDTGGCANAAAFAPDGAEVAVARSRAPPRAGRDAARDPAGRVLLWRPASRIEPRALLGHLGAVSSVAWSADGRALLSGSWDGTVRLWDRATGRERARLGVFPSAVRGVAAGSRTRWAAAASWGSAPDEPATSLLRLGASP